MLLYGGFDDSPETTKAVGREIVAALQSVGLGTEWDHGPGRAITVTPLDWRCRLVGQDRNSSGGWFTRLEHCVAPVTD